MEMVINSEKKQADFRGAPLGPWWVRFKGTSALNCKNPAMPRSRHNIEARNIFIYGYFSFYEQLKFRTQLSWTWKKFYNLGAEPDKTSTTWHSDE